MKLFATITEVLCLRTQYETERVQVLHRDYIIYSSCFVEAQQKRPNCREIFADRFWLGPTLPTVTECTTSSLSQSAQHLPCHRVHNILLPQSAQHLPCHRVHSIFLFTECTTSSLHFPLSRSGTSRNLRVVELGPT